MLDKFLRLSVLPGAPIESKECRSLLALLLIVIVIDAMVFFSTWFNKPLSGQHIYTAPAVNTIETMRARIVAQLNDSIVQLSPESVIAIRKQLDGSKVTLSESQKEAIRKQLSETAVQ